jgi:hypothetical protein
VTILQKPHALGGFGFTPNVIAKTSGKSTDSKCRKCTRYKTILLPLLTFSNYLLSIAFTRFTYEIRDYLNRGILDRLCGVDRIGPK